MPYVWNYQAADQAGGQLKNSPSQARDARSAGGGFTPWQAALSHDFVGYWLAFTISGGDPNGGPAGLAPAMRWPRHETTGTQAVLNFNETNRVVSGTFLEETCAFWEGYAIAEPANDAQ